MAKPHLRLEFLANSDFGCNNTGYSAIEFPDARLLRLARRAGSGRRAGGESDSALRAEHLSRSDSAQFCRWNLVMVNAYLGGVAPLGLRER